MNREKRKNESVNSIRQQTVDTGLAPSFDARTAPSIDVIMIRHAQSQWNRENRFTGWANPPLTEAGIEEARQAAHCLKLQGFEFDKAYSSRLQRAIATRELILESAENTVEAKEDWRLNERHYGMLQGLDKAESTSQAGEEQVWRWRRAYFERAEPIPRWHRQHPQHDHTYADIHPSRLPAVENLAETRSRVSEFWYQQVLPDIHDGKRILISAHGNTLRALIMELSGMSIDEVEQFEIPTATPIIYRFMQDGTPLDWRYLEKNCDQAHAA